MASRVPGIGGLKTEHPGPMCARSVFLERDRGHRWLAGLASRAGLPMPMFEVARSGPGPIGFVARAPAPRRAGRYRETATMESLWPRDAARGDELDTVAPYIHR